MSSYLLINDGDSISAGAPITPGPLNPHDILRIQGTEALQRYLIDEVQAVYRSQGVTIHDKHIEVIVSQMLRRVNVDSSGDTEYIPGQIVDSREFGEINAQMESEGKEPATSLPILLGITRASLLTDSFLAAASFQETTRVLTQAAISGSHDQLQGLKENVIIGRLIPAKLDTPEMRELLEAEEVEQVLEPAEFQAAKWLDEDGPEMVDDTVTVAAESLMEDEDNQETSESSEPSEDILSIVEESVFDTDDTTAEEPEESISSIFDGDDASTVAPDSEQDSNLESF